MKMNKGFTRSDMLMVVMCVMVLAVGLGAMGTAGQERGKIIICQSNLRHWGMALNSYSQDNQGEFPNSYTWFYNSMWRWQNSTAPWCRWHNPWDSLENNPIFRGSLWGYLGDDKYALCPTFSRLATSGWGKYHTGHIEGIPMETHYTYSMNGYLGKHRRTRFGVAGTISEVSVDPSKVMTFTEENIWDIRGRSASNAVLSNNNFVARINSRGIREKDKSLLTPETYNGAIATFHNAPSNSLDVTMSDHEYFAVEDPPGSYPSWGLCQGGGNAAFLDGHVELVPKEVDAFDISWPLK